MEGRSSRGLCKESLESAHTKIKQKVQAGTKGSGAGADSPAADVSRQGRNRASRALQVGTIKLLLMSLGRREGVMEEYKGEGRGSAKAVSLEAQLPWPRAER